MYAFLRFPNFRRKVLTLSYDDGAKYDKQLVEILDRNGLKGTFNINSKLFKTTPNSTKMTQEECVALYANSGHEVAVHGAAHLSLGEVDEAVATRDVISDREKLEEVFDTIIKGMAYANGSVDGRVVDIVKHCGIHYSRTIFSTESFELPENWLLLNPTCHHNSPRLMELAKKFLEAGEGPRCWTNPPMMFYLWGHSFEFNKDNNWEVIENFASFMGNRSDIWYATNGEIYDYVQAYNSLSYSVNGDIIHNPSAQDVYLSYYGEKILVPAGKTIKAF